MAIVALPLTILVLAIIAFCLWYFERMLARKSSRIPGLVMPVGFLLISVLSIVQSVPTVFAQLEELGGISGVIITLLVSFVITNIPTIWVAFVYHRTRRKMGDAHPWSHAQKDKTERGENASEQSTQQIDKKDE